MDRDKELLLSLLFALTSISVLFNISVSATTEESSDEGETNGTFSNIGDIVGTVQNISQPVNILSHSAREDGGYLHVVGEVENGLSRNIDFVKITGTFYDANNQVIGTDFVFTDPSSLEAGETAPFDLTLFTDAVDPSQVSSYKIRVSWQ